LTNLRKRIGELRPSCVPAAPPTVEAAAAGGGDEPALYHWLIVCDKCDEDLMDHVRAEARAADPRGKVTVVETAFGNGAASFRFALQTIVGSSVPSWAFVYMVEDDYVHVPHALGVIFDGLSVADFATGYDHPDKYGHRTTGNPRAALPAGSRDTLVPLGNNVPLVSSPPTFASAMSEDGGRVMLGATGHFRETNSTTMTFATRVSCLRAVASEILPFVSESHPHDFFLWIYLRAVHNRRLVHALPSVSTHGETAFLAPRPRLPAGQTWASVMRD